MADTDMMCPPDFTGIVLDVLTYLHTRGVVRDPDGDQHNPVVGEKSRPACFVAGWDDSPDHAVTIIGPYNQSHDSQVSPMVEFTIGVRTDPWNGLQLQTTSQAILTALTIDHPTHLTADRRVLYCHRVRVDAPTRDDNDRWRIAHTYQLRPANNTP